MLLALPTGAYAVSASRYKYNLLYYINRYRIHHGLHRLRINDHLQTAAQAHSHDMARTRRMTHSSSNGCSWSTRIRYYGYRGPYLGENLAYGRMTARTTVRWWINSAEHRANLLRGVYDHVGLGFAKAGYGDRVTYYVTADFGGW